MRGEIGDWLGDQLVKRPHRLLLELPLPRAEHEWQYARSVARWREAPIPLAELEIGGFSRPPRCRPSLQGSFSASSFEWLASSWV